MKHYLIVFCVVYVFFLSIGLYNSEDWLSVFNMEGLVSIAKISGIATLVWWFLKPAVNDYSEIVNAAKKINNEK